MKKINEHVKNLSFFTLILVLSPLVDLGISIIHVHSPNVSFLGSAIRGFLLVGVLFYSFFIRKESNKIILYYLIVLLSFMGIFIALKDFAFEEIISILKFFFYPLIVGCFLLHKEDLQKVKNALYVSGIIYMLLLLIPLLTGTAFRTYTYMKSGFFGWFSSPNEISAIVSLIFPFIVLKVLEENTLRRKLRFFLITAAYIYVIFTIGTKVPVLTVIITLFCVLLTIIVRFFLRGEDKKQAKLNLGILCCLIIVSVFYFYNGSALNNIVLQNNYFVPEVDGGQEPPVNVPGDEPSKPNVPDNEKPITPPKPNVPDENKPSDNKPDKPQVEMPKFDIGDNYSLLFQELFTEELVESKKEYVSPKFINLIFSSRDIYFMRKLSLWSDDNFITKLFGSGLKYSFNGETSKKLVEIDFVDVFFCYGIIGFVLYFTIVISILWILLKYFIKNFIKIIKNYELYVFFVTVGLAVLISCFSGHILGAPSVSLLLAIITATLFNETTKIKLEKNNFLTWKKLLLIIIPVVIAVSFSYLYSQVLQNEDNKIKLVYNNGDIKLNDLTKKIDLIEEKNIDSNYAMDNLKYYSVKDHGITILRFVLVTRTFDSNIQHIYFTGQNVTDKEYEIILSSNDKFNEYQTFENREIVKEYSTSVGYDKRTLPSAYVVGKKYSAIYYKTYIYDVAKMEYSDGNYSILKNLIKEDNSLEISKNKVKNTFLLAENEMFDNAWVRSNKNLFANEKEIQTFIDYVNSGKTSSWISFDGAYVKLGYSIEPYTTEGYGRNLDAMAEKDLYYLFRDTNNKLFESYVLSSIHVFDKYLPRHSSGIWLTEYTSTWLKKDYKIKSLYIDTRHNDNIAYYMNKLSKYYEDEHLLELSYLYADYLVYEYLKENVITLNQGVLIPDYFSSHHSIKTHSSLNHQLAIINYLLKSYIATDKEEYKTVALKCLKTITNLGTKWITQKGDLYYQINSKGEFSGEDYSELTLKDLLTTQDLLEEIGQKRSKELDKLIKSKLNYLIDINYNITGILQKQLKEGGYIE